MCAQHHPVHHSAVLPDTTPAEVFAVITDLPAYPRLFPELKTAKVIHREGPLVRAEFGGQMVLPFRYVLDLHCKLDQGRVDWTFVEGEVIKNSTGGWRLSPEGNGTRVDYQVTMDIEAPLPGFLLRKITNGLVSLSLPAMFESIRREVVRRRSGGGGQ